MGELKYEIECKFKLTKWFYVIKLIAYLNLGRFFMFIADKPICEMKIGNQKTIKLSYYDLINES